jgi:uncharacterized protein YjfI (DUF2170 family)
MATSKRLNPGAKRQKALRDRMARMGMTIPRIYMDESERALVREFLRDYRSTHTERLIEGMDFSSMNSKWSVPRLYEALQEHGRRHGQFADLRQHSARPAIELSLARYDRQPVQIVVTGHEIFVASALCERHAIRHKAKFDETCLRLGPMLPLSNVGLVGNHYILFGQLSAHAPLSNIVEELDVLGRNVVDALGQLSGLIR